MDYIQWKLSQENNIWDYDGASYAVNRDYKGINKRAILAELYTAREECKAEGDIRNMNKYQELITNYTLGRIK